MYVLVYTGLPVCICIYTYIYIYVHMCLGCQVSWPLAPPPCYGPGDGLPQRVEYAYHACICKHMESYAYIYAPACQNLHMHARDMHVGICM